MIMMTMISMIMIILVMMKNISLATFQNVPHSAQYHGHHDDDGNDDDIDYDHHHYNDHQVQEWDTGKKQQRIPDQADGQPSRLHNQHSVICAGGFYHNKKEI